MSQEEFNKICDEYRKMYNKLDGKSHEEQIKLINQFRSGNIE